MIAILRPLFEILTSDVAVCDNIIYNYLIMLIVSEIAFRFAFSLIGDAYNAGAISGKTAGSVLHWTIRFVIYIVAAYLLRGVIWLYNFVTSVLHLVWWLCFGLIVAGILAFVIIKHIINEREKIYE